MIALVTTGELSSLSCSQGQTESCTLAAVLVGGGGDKAGGSSGESQGQTALPEDSTVVSRRTGANLGFGGSLS